MNSNLNNVYLENLREATLRRTEDELLNSDPDLFLWETNVVSKLTEVAMDLGDDKDVPVSDIIKVLQSIDTHHLINRLVERVEARQHLA